VRGSGFSRVRTPSPGATRRPLSRWGEVKRKRGALRVRAGVKRIISRWAVVGDAGAEPAARGPLRPWRDPRGSDRQNVLIERRSPLPAGLGDQVPFQGLGLVSSARPVRWPARDARRFCAIGPVLLGGLAQQRDGGGLVLRGSSAVYRARWRIRTSASTLSAMRGRLQQPHRPFRHPSRRPVAFLVEGRQRNNAASGLPAFGGQSQPIRPNA